MHLLHINCLIKFINQLTGNQYSLDSKSTFTNEFTKVKTKKRWTKTIIYYS